MKHRNTFPFYRAFYSSVRKKSDYLKTCLSSNVSMYPENRNFTIKYQHINVLSSDRDEPASFESKHVLIYLWKGDILSVTYMKRIKKSTTRK